MQGELGGRAPGTGRSKVCGACEVWSLLAGLAMAEKSELGREKVGKKVRLTCSGWSSHSALQAQGRDIAMSME